MLPLRKSLVCVLEHVMPEFEVLELVTNGEVDQVFIEVPVRKQVGQLGRFWALVRLRELRLQPLFELLHVARRQPPPEMTRHTTRMKHPTPQLSKGIREGTWKLCSGPTRAALSLSNHRFSSANSLMEWCLLCDGYREGKQQSRLPSWTTWPTRLLTALSSSVHVRRNPWGQALRIKEG